MFDPHAQKMILGFDPNVEPISKESVKLLRRQSYFSDVAGMEFPREPERLEEPSATEVSGWVEIEIKFPDFESVSLLEKMESDLSLMLKPIELRYEARLAALTEALSVPGRYAPFPFVVCKNVEELRAMRAKSFQEAEAVVRSFPKSMPISVP